MKTLIAPTLCITILVVLMIFSGYAYNHTFSEGVDFGRKNTLTPIDNIEMFCNKLEALDEDIYLTWLRSDGARIQICIRGKDRQLYAFSRPSTDQPEYIRVSNGKPLWYEDGTYGLTDFSFD